jgi:chitinase
MELNVFNDIDDPLTHFSMRACSVAGGTQASTLTKRGPFHYPVLQERQLLSPNASISNTTYINGTFTSATAPAVSVNKCANEAQAVAVSADVNILSWGSGNSSDSADASSVVAALEGFLQLDATCIQAKTAINVFARSGNTIAGLYIGSQITKSSISTLLSKFSDGKTADASQQTAMELCASQVIGPQVFGLYVDTTGGLSSVQKTLQSWNNATCLGGPDATAAWSGSSVSIIPGNAIPVVPTDQSVNGTGVATAAPGTASTSRKLFKRDTCTYTQAVSGDGCWSMSQRCGISLDDFETYNGGADFCNTLVVGEYACCSAGTLPDFSPQPQANGDCSTYTIQANDICSAIAAANTMTTDQIEARNTDTWGWMGCTDLLVGQVICLSTGTPPMPSALDGAVCGPQVPGTAQPADMSTLASLNPCLLNAWFVWHVCLGISADNSSCDIWGQCGITSDFCTADPASTGAPGTALPGTNGCISNCGTDIVAGDAPAEFFRVGYYESFSVSRPCLRMVPSDIPTDGSYTHVHYAFAGITSDYQVDISNSFEEFSEFTQTTGFKKVLSFGGWSFSTDEDSFPIFREGVTDANRQTFANSVVAVCLSLVRALLNYNSSSINMTLTGLISIGSILVLLTFQAFRPGAPPMGPTIYLFCSLSGMLCQRERLSRLRHQHPTGI